MTRTQARALLALIADCYAIIVAQDPIPVPNNGKQQSEPQSSTVE